MVFEPVVYDDAAHAVVTDVSVSFEKPVHELVRANGGRGSVTKHPRNGRIVLLVEAADVDWLKGGSASPCDAEVFFDPGGWFEAVAPADGCSDAKALRKAGKKWKIQPYTLQGTPVTVGVSVAAE